MICNNCIHKELCNGWEQRTEYIKPVKNEICDHFADVSEMIKLPCKVGDTVWTIENVFNGKSVVQMLGSRVIDEIRHNKLNKNTMISNEPFELHFYPSQIGKTVFLTQKDAQAELERLEGKK